MKRLLLISTILLLPSAALSQFHASGPIGGDMILVGSNGGHSGGGSATFPVRSPPPPPRTFAPHAPAPMRHAVQSRRKLVCQWHHTGQRRWKTCKR